MHADPRTVEQKPVFPAFGFLMPREVRTFGLVDLTAAQGWITAD
jgi:hypothetical protein